jgi:DNA mismatch endonuclease (patch repair protein)
MSRLPTAGTGPELAIRRNLHRRGLRYRVNVKGLPGRPDVVFTRARLAVQVDGCFWHGCPEHAVQPKANARWWRDKIAANRARDARNDKALEEAGWTVLRIWEHEDPSVAGDQIEEEWRARTGRVGGQSARPAHTPRTGQA